LNVLAARVPSTGQGGAAMTGKVCINGVERDDEVFRTMSAYVLQDDNLYPHLTVYETFILAAHFYLPDDVTLEQKEALVQGVISELGLNKCRNTIIGNEKVRGVSGGERKRANIGQQLISDPAVLFLDEPTSGLDSFQAQSVMQSMKNVASNGRLVISVIHQPRSTIYDMFDQLLLLSEGQQMYLGPASGATEYFAKLGFLCPKLFNPSDFFLDILSPDIRSVEAEQLTSARIIEFAKQWESRPVDVEKDIVYSGAVTKRIGGPISLPRFVRNFQLLCWRSFSEQAREVPTIVIKICITIFFAAIIGGIYSNVGYTQASIMNRAGLLFVVCLNNGFNNVIGVLNTFPKEKIIVNRERSCGAYDTLSYFTAKFVCEIPLNVLPSLIYSCIVYWIVGLNPNTFGQFILITMFEAITAVCLGLAIGAICPSVDSVSGCSTLVSLLVPSPVYLIL
jgi:ABC-type multidrug transport system ATPase subunit